MVDIKNIIILQINQLNKRLADRKIVIELSEAATDYLVKEGYDPVYGARPLKRAIQRLVLDPLAVQVLDGKFKENDKIAVDVKEDKIIFNK